MAISEKFPALVVTDGKAEIGMFDESFLHDGNVTIRVLLSAINYKDALAVTNKGKVLRSSRIIPGVDYCGEVCASDDAAFAVGDKVVMTGQGAGESFSGGFAAYARADADMLLHVPQGMDEQQAMICGTAGFTAALCALALHESGHVRQGGTVVVSGATGGVGSFAVILLSRLGYRVTAISRKAAGKYLSLLGAEDVVTYDSFVQKPRPLEKARWAGGVDCVGGNVLSRMLAETEIGGVVAMCGLAASAELETSVMPFILRGVRLEGIAASAIKGRLRQKAWQLLTDHLTEKDYRLLECSCINLSELPESCDDVLHGKHTGRVLVKPQL